MISPVLSCGLLWLFVRDWPFAIGVWLGTRVFALWVNMVQNYWTHDRRWGTRRYETADDSRNNWLLGLLTLGEGWHNNHHHYCASARQGFRWWEIDVTYYLLRALAAVGVVWEIREPPRHVVEAELPLDRAA